MEDSAANNLQLQVKSGSNNERCMGFILSYHQPGA